MRMWMDFVGTLSFWGVISNLLPRRPYDKVQDPRCGFWDLDYWFHFSSMHIILGDLWYYRTSIWDMGYGVKWLLLGLFLVAKYIAAWRQNKGAAILFKGFWGGEYITQICHILREKEEVEIVIFRP